MSASTPTRPPPKASPGSFSRTRWYPLPSAGRKAVGADSGGVVSVNASSLARCHWGNPSASGLCDPPGRANGPAPGGERGRGDGKGPCPHRSRARGGTLQGGLSDLADLEAGEPLDGQTGLVDDLLHRALGLGDGRLLEQDEVLEVGVDPTFDDLDDRLLGLALLLGGLLGDATLGLDRLGRDLVAGQVARTRGGDVHGQAARGVLAATAVLHGDTDGRGQVGGALVQVGRGG